MNLLTLDHLALSCTQLDAGTLHVEQKLGVPVLSGGKHALMGTHNTLLGLQNNLYFEVIAIDPEAPPPKRPRWFNLDAFDGPPRLTNWIFRTPDLRAALETLPEGFGTPVSFERGDLRWQMAVPDDGILPWGGWAPAIIQWEGDMHPTQALSAADVTIEQITLKHPQAEDIAQCLAPLMPRDTALFEISDAPALEARMQAPSGHVILT
ncbi:MAG: VOC family protein [Litoreibacter sp.]